MTFSKFVADPRTIPVLTCPIEHGPGSNAQERIEDFLSSHHSVRYIRFQWQDHSGVLRARLVPVGRAKEIAAGSQILHVPPIAFQCIVDNNLHPETSPIGNYWLFPDWRSLRTRPTFDSSYATVMCCLVEQDHPARPGPNWHHCPRSALATIVHKAASRFKTTFLIGFEVEFEFMKSSANGDLVPASLGLGRFAVAGLRDPCFSVVEEAVQVLLDAGVLIDAFQTEGRCGQYEISLSPLQPLPAIDQLVQVHDTLKHIGRHHGLVVTMFPRPITGRRQACGQHTHISIHPPARHDWFLAGVLQRLPALCALTLPYEFSYERVQPYLAGEVVGWGTENREVPIRQVAIGHWELRCVDGTANMYLALAAILSAGLLGIANQEPLSWPDLSFSSPAHNNDKGGAENATDPQPSQLPRSMEGALDELARNHDELETMMESQVIQHYINIKRFELARLREWDPQKIRELLVELF
ncbi:hypothetical protein CNMCM7691_008625 [Aspergillus felis]|uniref:Glutamine synthetase n=1 Tax=Aspergillus felis TaxID=1287682 RepID=A0A8H6V6I7_9EURO|nr:hypothetical protein CNMCM7691_008625 [Aspergillus felis]